jgi:ribonucleotide reductase beta subunit family protein with ferritin-like domain
MNNTRLIITILDGEYTFQKQVYNSELNEWKTVELDMSKDHKEFRQAVNEAMKTSIIESKGLK